MKGGKTPLSSDFRFTSNPASGGAPARPAIAGPIPEIAVQGVPRPLGPFERTFLPKDTGYSEALVEFVRNKERFEPRPYLDLKTEGKPTIGYGHVLPEQYDAAMQWTREQAEDVLRRDLDTALGAVRRQVSAPLTQSQLDALTSLVFNVGEGNYKGSQSQAKLHKGDYTGAATEMLTFDNVRIGGKKVPLNSLTERRRLEAEMFAGPYKHLLPPDRPKTR